MSMYQAGPERARLRGVGELPRHDFGVDGVGDTRGVVAGDQAEVADVLEVSSGERALVAPTQQRLDDAAHAVFLELVGELVEVDLPALNKMLPGVEDVGGGDRAGLVAPRLVVEADPAAQRVHQPWLALGLSPYRIERPRVNACPVSPVCWASRACTSVSVKSPMRRDSALTLNALPPATTAFSERDRMR